MFADDVRLTGSGVELRKVLNGMVKSSRRNMGLKSINAKQKVMESFIN